MCIHIYIYTCTYTHGYIYIYIFIHINPHALNPQAWKSLLTCMLACRKHDLDHSSYRNPNMGYHSLRRSFRRLPAMTPTATAPPTRPETASWQTAGPDDLRASIDLGLPRWGLCRRRYPATPLCSRGGPVLGDPGQLSTVSVPSIAAAGSGVWFYTSFINPRWFMGMLQ